MKYYFLDTSAFVRIYSGEPGQERVRDMVRSATSPTPTARVVVCDFVLPEAAAALTQRLAQKHLTRAACDRAMARLLSDLTEACPFVVIHSSSVMAEGFALARTHRLRGADAVHLAAALAARAAVPAGGELVFVSTDEDQCRAARVEGFTVYDPAEGERLPAISV